MVDDRDRPWFLLLSGLLSVCRLLTSSSSTDPELRYISRPRRFVKNLPFPSFPKRGFELRRGNSPFEQKGTKGDLTENFSRHIG
jgi:hypothetical protein